MSAKEIVRGILVGNKRFLAKAITLVESKKPEHRIIAEAVLQEIISAAHQSVRIGITGVPGAGKSTFIESFGKLAIAKGKKVAVLAIDPSSTINKGSILGDKTRMEDLAREENAFIRPSPTSGFLGGIANTTYESILLCEAAGYDFILIETVGVGQSEVLVHDISDVFLFLKIIGGGDELQGIKRGIMEMVDLIFINKVEAENVVKAKQTKVELKRALHFLPQKEKNWKVPVLLGSALENTGLEEIYTEIDHFITTTKDSGNFTLKREDQAKKRFDYWIQHYILEKTKNNTAMQKQYEKSKKNASELKSNPSTEAKIFVELLLNKAKS